MEARAGVRVDGVDGGVYVVGSREHGLYVARYDEAYIEEHAELVRRNVDMVPRMAEAGGIGRLDANQTMFLARELVFLRGTVERRIYEDLRMREFVEIEQHPRGARTYETKIASQVGEAKVSHDLAGDDPRADAYVEADENKYVNARGSYAYTTEDLEQAAFAGVPIEREKADACAEMIARKVDEIGRVGSAPHGLTGFFNNPNVNVVTLTNGEWTSSATADEIAADVHQIEQAIIAQAGDTQPKDKSYTLVLPTAAEGRLALLLRHSNSDLSVLEWIQKRSRLIGAVVRYGALDDATGADTGVSDDPMGICYPKDKRVLFWPISIVYEEQAPQLRGWEYTVRGRARVGGIEIRRPVHMVYIENLD